MIDTIISPILIVDDDADDRHLVTMVLQAIGVAQPVLAIDSVDTAMVRLAQGIRPKLIISDINMPGENGIAFKRRLQYLQTPGAPDIPFVFLTTVSSKATIDAVQAAVGAVPVYEKPSSLPELRELLISILQYWHLL